MKLPKYRHLKTGNIYERVGLGTDATNARNGSVVVVYTREGDDSLFVRDYDEFLEKFEKVEQDNEEVIP